MKTLLTLMLVASMQASALEPAPVAATPPAVAIAQPAVQAHPQGQIESAAMVTDPDFGVHAKALGLERRVEKTPALCWPAEPLCELRQGVLSLPRLAVLQHSLR